MIYGGLKGYEKKKKKENPFIQGTLTPESAKGITSSRFIENTGVPAGGVKLTPDAIAAVEPSGSMRGNVGLALAGTGPMQSSGASRFVNFDRLLSSNQPGAEKMAQQAYKTVEEKGKQAEKGISKLTKAFEKESQQKGLKFGGETIELPDAGPLTGGTKIEGYTPKLGGGTTAVVSGEQEGLEGIPQKSEGVIGTPGGKGISIEEARRLSQQQYEGPENLSQISGYGQAQTNLQKALDALTATKQQGGLEALLNEAYKTAGGTGGSRLDAALAQVAAGESLKKLGSRFAGLEKMLQEADLQAQKTYGEKLGEAGEVRAQYEDLVNRALAEQSYWDEVKKAQEEERKKQAARAKDKKIVATNVGTGF